MAATRKRYSFLDADGHRVTFLGAKPAASKRSTKRKPAASKRPKACTCKRGGRR